MSKLNEQKTLLRKEMLVRRRAIKGISFNPELFLTHPTFSSCKKIAAYWPMAGELDIRPLLEQLENCCLPVVADKAAPLVFRKWQWGGLLIDGLHHTKHPEDTQKTIIPDLVLVPLLAFDQKGGRLGFGGGYYDRTLAELPALRVGVGFDEQEVENVPVDKFDQKMDWIVTPARVIRCDL